MKLQIKNHINLTQEILNRDDIKEIIFNSKMYDWGVKYTDQTASRDPENDVLIVTVPVSKSLTNIEKFTISFTENKAGTLMILAWDTVVVPVLLQEK